MEKGYYDPEEAIEAIYCYFDLLKEKEAEIQVIEEEMEELRQIIDGKSRTLQEISTYIFNVADDFNISDEKLRKIEKEMNYKL